jgi:uncharacterized membrane protein YkvA (DUF1232 family)
LAIAANLRNKARALRHETVALYFAVRDPRTPFAAKLIAGLVVAYALSPIDLIPDFIPIVGYLDDLILIPLGIAVALRLIPAEVLAASRAKADITLSKPTSYAAAVVIVLLWIVAGTLFSIWLYDLFAGRST